VQFVTAYMDRLLRLADNATLRSELAQFPLAADAEDAVLPEHRAGGAQGISKHKLGVHLNLHRLFRQKDPWKCQRHACSWRCWQRTAPSAIQTGIGWACSLETPSAALAGGRPGRCRAFVCSVQPPQPMFVADQSSKQVSTSLGVPCTKVLNLVRSR
jgi:hypothetical protein